MVFDIICNLPQPFYILLEIVHISQMFLHELVPLLSRFIYNSSV